MGFEDEDEDGVSLDVLLGMTYQLLRDSGDEQAALLVLDVESLRLDFLRSEPDSTSVFGARSVIGAVLDVEPYLVERFTPEVRERIWAKLGYVLRRHHRSADEIAVQEALPEVPVDWRDRGERDFTAERATNHARRERRDAANPVYDGLTFGSLAEIAVYKSLVTLQQAAHEARAFAIVPLPTVRLQRMGQRTPDFLIVGNGRALVIEVDGPHHGNSRRYADDRTKDLHWERCGVRTFRLTVEQTAEDASLGPLLREALVRELYR
ncbi:hypothetical protein [Modestobacter sp. SYSU DS0290]